MNPMEMESVQSQIQMKMKILSLIIICLFCFIFGVGVGREDILNWPYPSTHRLEIRQKDEKKYQKIIEKYTTSDFNVELKIIRFWPRLFLLSSDCDFPLERVTSVLQFSGSFTQEISSFVSAFEAGAEMEGYQPSLNTYTWYIVYYIQKSEKRIHTLNKYKRK